jgi:hypothetical protein
MHRYAHYAFLALLGDRPSVNRWKLIGAQKRRMRLTHSAVSESGSTFMVLRR